MYYLPEKYWNKFKQSSKIFPSKFSGYKFENLIEELLQILYGKKWGRTKKTHDNNRDFWIILNNERLWAECKNYKDKIAMDVLAPTLVMAQIYDANKILFFSRSEINSKAKDKILAFGEKTEKKIIFYDAKILENLIINNAAKLSKRYRPSKYLFCDDEDDNFVSLYFFQDAVSNLLVDEEELLEYMLADKIRYNEVFSLILIIKNPYPSEKIQIDISFFHINPDRFRYQYFDNNIVSDKNLISNIFLRPGEGKSITINLRPIVFKNQMSLPRLEVNLLKKNQKIQKWVSKDKTVSCSWSGRTKLIGSQYERILECIELKLVDNAKLSSLILTGTSGTGKSRMLMECRNIFMKYGYRIFAVSADEHFSFSFFIKEIIFFIYEIPKSLIMPILEEKLKNGYYIDDSFKNRQHPSLTKALEMIKYVNEEKKDYSLKNFIDTYGDIIFEKISYSKCLIIIDNLQYADEEFQYFIERYVVYSVNQNRTNYSVLACVFNKDYLNERSSCLLFHLFNLNIPYLLSYELNGFKDVNQGILFLRELIHTDQEELDQYFRRLINLVSLKPYNLYQTVHLLEEENLIKVTPENQGYLFIDVNAWGSILELNQSFIDILNARWSFVINNIDESKILLIFSILYLFDHIDMI